MSENILNSGSNHAELNLHSWRKLSIVTVALLVALIASYWSTFVSMVEIWTRSGTFNHGFLIFPIAGYLIYIKRDTLVNVECSSSWGGLFALATLVLLWSIAYLVNVNVLTQFAVVAMIPALVWSLLGLKMVRALLFPLTYLFFAVPFGEFLVPSLQDLTASITVYALQWVGIPVYLEGRYLAIPSGNFQVAEACSGIRYLIASIALGTLYAYIMYRSNRRRLLFIAFAILLPLIANGIRAFGIVMLAHLSDYKLATGFDHIIYGWLFFGIVMAALFWVGGLFREDELDVNGSSSVAHFNLTSYTISPRVIGLCFVLIFLGPLLIIWANTSKHVGASLDVSLPKNVSGWMTMNSVGKAQWNPVFNGSTEFFNEYSNQKGTVQLYVASYHYHNQQGEMINSLNSVYDKKRAKRVSDANKTIVLQNGIKWSVHSTTINAGENMRLIWHWYDVGGITTSRSALAKGLEIYAQVVQPKRSSLAVIVSTTYQDSPEEAEVRLNNFLTAALTKINAINQAN